MDHPQKGSYACWGERGTPCSVECCGHNFGLSYVTSLGVFSRADYLTLASQILTWWRQILHDAQWRSPRKRSSQTGFSYRQDGIKLTVWCRTQDLYTQSVCGYCNIALPYHRNGLWQQLIGVSPWLSHTFFPCKKVGWIVAVQFIPGVALKFWRRVICVKTPYWVHKPREKNHVQAHNQRCWNSLCDFRGTISPTPRCGR